MKYLVRIGFDKVSYLTRDIDPDWGMRFRHQATDVADPFIDTCRFDSMSDAQEALTEATAQLKRDWENPTGLAAHPNIARAFQRILAEYEKAVIISNY